MLRQATEGYHLSGCYITVTILLPTLPGIPLTRKCKRAVYLACFGKPGYTWHCSTQGLPSRPVTGPRRELLPHVFTLTPILIGTVIFCGTLFPALRPGPAVNRCVALYCPDFPFHCEGNGTITRFAASAKLRF